MGRRPSECRDAARRLAEESAEDWRTQGLGMWALVSATDPRFLGCCGFGWIEQLGRFELFFLLDPSVWGRGLMTECVHQALRFGGARRPDALVFALVHVENLRSRRVLERSGFQHRWDVVHGGLPVAYFVGRRVPGP